MEPLVIPCSNGVFEMPPEAVAAIRTGDGGIVYVRHDEESMIVSAEPLSGGKRRHIHRFYSAPIFRDATRLVVIPMPHAVQIMAIRWRGRHRPSLDAGES